MNCAAQLRPARLAEAVEIAVMSRDLVEHGLGWSWTPDRVREQIRCRDACVLVAPAAQGLRGFAIMYFAPVEAHLLLLAVRPEHRGRGLGRSLLHWLEVSAQACGVGTVYLEVRAGNTGAQGFYRRLGYRALARLRGYYGGRESALRMGRDLWAGAEAG